MFLVGKNIPEYIRNLPETFLNTPFGQMMKPQIDNALRGVAQGPGPAQAPQVPARPASTPSAPPSAGKVQMVNNLRQLEAALASASQSCAVIFFTSATCPPCKIVYPTYDELAEEAGSKAVLIKVDLSTARDVGMKYSVRATPTFMTFLKGEKVDEWRGANPAQLRGNVRMLIEMAYPVHRHRQLHVPSLQRPITNYVLYKKVPPLDKVVGKLGNHSENPAVVSMIKFIKATMGTSSSAPLADTPLPDLASFSSFIQSTFDSLPPDNQFALVDLVRLLFLDPRVSGYFAEEHDQRTLLTLVAPSRSLSSCPYNLRIVLLHLACNLFSSPLYPPQVISQHLREPYFHLVTNSLLDSSHPALRVVAASFAYNLAAFNHNARWDGRPDPLSDEAQVELTASLIEALAHEEGSPQVLHGLLFALGLMVYEAPLEGELIDLCKAMGVVDTVLGKRNVPAGKNEEGLIKEVGQELLRKGL